MTSIIMDGRSVANQIKQKLKIDIERLKRKKIVPGLAVIQVSGDPASEIYVNSKVKMCRELGIESRVYKLPNDCDQNNILSLIDRLNHDKMVHGILVQLPLPKCMNTQQIIESISRFKDVDCFHPYNLGKLFSGNPFILPCTPAGIIELIRFYNIDILGKECVIVGRSNIVGKPLSILMLQNNATVTVCHSKTENLTGITRRADIIISAIGKPEFITCDFIKSGAVVIDVGVNKIGSKTVGDVQFETVKEVANAISPVPGGVGPMTIMMLMKNTIALCENEQYK